MDISGGMKASLAGRYASALFDLARDKGRLDHVKANLDQMKDAIQQSDDLARLIDSPAVSNDAAARTMASLSKAMKFDALTANFLGVMAGKGRLGQVPQAIKVFDALVAAHRGEARAEVVSARPLTKAQLKALSANLSARAGRDVTLETSVDPDLLGGVRIRMGSQLIDASVATKLNSLAMQMASSAR